VTRDEAPFAENFVQSPAQNPARSVGIIGYGRFGRVLADGLRGDFELRIHDPLADFSHSPEPASNLAHTASSDAVFVCVPIVAFERVIAQAAPHLCSGATVLDVCSVKMFPEQVMKRLLRPDIHIVPTHPMFGPDTAKNGWRELPLALCPLPNNSAAYKESCDFWRTYFANVKGCAVTELSSEEHDRITAHTLCLTQLLGRVLGNIGLQSSPIDAQSFKHLLKMKEISYNDSMELLIGLHKYNPFASAMRQRLREEFQAVEPFLQEEFALLSP
jgi:prephenate dehydrogenase